MKRTIVWALVILGTFFLGLVIGRSIQHMKGGYFYEVRNEKVIPFSLGPILLQYVTKSVGLPFLDPGTSVLTLDDEKCGRITIYEARRGFQESHPYVTNVSVRDDEVRWDDGVYRYSLRIERLPSPTASAAEDTKADSSNP